MGDWRIRLSWAGLGIDVQLSSGFGSHQAGLQCPVSPSECTRTQSLRIASEGLDDWVVTHLHPWSFTALTGLRRVLAAGIATLVCIASNPDFGPVFARRGPYEYPCRLTISDVGIESSFPGTEDFLPWSKSFEWTDATSVDLGANPSGALLTVVSRRSIIHGRSHHVDRDDVQPWTVADGWQIERQASIGCEVRILPQARRRWA